MASLRVRDLMTADVKTVKAADSVSAAQDLMNEHNFRHVPVVDEEGLLIGLVTERDLLRRAHLAQEDLPLNVRQDVLHAVRVSQIMTEEIETIGADALARTAAETLLETKYGCLPVVDEGYLIGILTEADFVRHVAESDF